MYQFKAELKGFESSVWRTYKTPNDISMIEFGVVTVLLFTPSIEHLFAFSNRSGEIDPSLNINEVFKRTNDSATLEYDFGDGWEISLKVQSIDSANEDVKFVGGAGYGLVENCGGEEGLENIIEGLKTESADNWDEIKKWLKKYHNDLLENDFEYCDEKKISQRIKDYKKIALNIDIDE